MQGLHAQARPPAYLVFEIDVTDTDLYKHYTSKAGPLQSQYSARFIAQGGRIVAFAGEPPKRAVIAVFDNLEKAQALRDSAEYKELTAMRDKASKYRGYIIEGASN
jgi:uncharacterized protein (DUF1330 family)